MTNISVTRKFANRVRRRNENVALCALEGIVGHAASGEAFEHRAVLRADDEEIRLDRAHDALYRPKRTCLVKHEPEARALNTRHIEVAQQPRARETLPLLHVALGRMEIESLRIEWAAIRRLESVHHRDRLALEESERGGGPDNLDEPVRQLGRNYNAAIPCDGRQIDDQGRNA